MIEHTLNQFMLHILNYHLECVDYLSLYYFLGTILLSISYRPEDHSIPIIKKSGIRRFLFSRNSKPFRHWVNHFYKNERYNWFDNIFLINSFEKKYSDSKLKYDIQVISKIIQ